MDDQPVYVHDLQGPIEVGQVFVWEPTSSLAVQTIQVTALRRRDDGELWIESKDLFRLRLEDPPEVLGHWNSEDRFREACVRVPMREVPPDQR